MADGEEHMPKTLTEEALDQKIDERVRKHISQSPDSEIADIVKGVAKDILSGDLDARIADSIDRAERKLRDRSPSEVALMKATGTTPEVAMSGGLYKGVPVKDSIAHHPMFRKSGGARIGDGEILGRGLFYAMRSMMDHGGRCDWKSIRDDAHEHGDKQLADLLTKNLEETDFGQGGSLVPSQMAADLIGFLEDKTVLRTLQPQRLTFDESGTIDLGRFTSTVSVSWGSEASGVNASTPNSDRLILSEKELKIMVVLAERFLRHAPGGAQAMVTDLMRKRAVAAEELARLRSDGSNDEVVGLYHLVAGGNRSTQTQAGSSSTVQEIAATLMGMQEDVYGADSNVIRDRGAYILQNRTRSGLMALTDSDDQLTFFTEMLANGELFGATAGITTVLPENLDASGDATNDETEIYFVEMSEMIIADGENLRVTESSDATVTDSSGSDVKLFETGQRALRLVHTTDQNLLHDTAASVREGIDWGADYLD
jgi:HK97 family phage major capsid protein